jgi:hypothetical protein
MWSEIGAPAFTKKLISLSSGQEGIFPTNHTKWLRLNCKSLALQMVRWNMDAYHYERVVHLLDK